MSHHEAAIDVLKRGIAELIDDAEYSESTAKSEQNSAEERESKLANAAECRALAESCLATLEFLERSA